MAFLLLHLMAAMLLAAANPYMGLAYLAFVYLVLKLNRIELRQKAVEESLQDLKVEVTVKLPEEDLQKHFPKDIRPYLDDASMN